MNLPSKSVCVTVVSTIVSLILITFNDATILSVSSIISIISSFWLYCKWFKYDSFIFVIFDLSFSNISHLIAEKLLSEFISLIENLKIS